MKPNPPVLPGRAICTITSSNRIMAKSFKTELAVARKSAAFDSRPLALRNKRQRVFVSRNDQAPGRSATANHAGVSRSLSFLREHGLEPIRVGDLARAATLSRRGFLKAFRRQAGESPGRKLRRHRLQHAQLLLLGSTLSLAEISRRSGFRHMNTFCVAFKREIGVSPMRFQRETVASLLGQEEFSNSENFRLPPENPSI